MPEEWGLFALAAAIFAAGLVAARWAYGDGMARATALAAKLPFLRRLLHRKWFVDELYQAVVLNPFYRLSDFFAAFDRWVVDGAVNGTARTTLALSYVKATVDRWGVDLAVNGVGWGVRMGSFALRRTQTGFVQSYAAMVVVGAFALLAAYLLFVR
jgi:NADH-quinone oxidoreductase subunit L